MMRAREDVKTGNSGPARQRKFKDPDTKHLLDSSKYHTPLETKQKGMNKPLKPVPVFKQNPGEHKRAFFYRVDQTIQSMKKRAQFEDKYKVDVLMDEKGKSKIVDREKDEVELELEKKRDEKLAKKGIVRKEMKNWLRR